MRLRARHLLYAALSAPPLAVLVAWLGIINVGAASGHLAVTDWFLHFAMRHSVRTWSLGRDAPEPLPLDARRPAAGHYADGCAPCHGAPGEPRPAAVLGMLPVPPDLAPRIDEWSDAELFRIVMRGIRLTGMPAWPSQARDDEVWGMVAFLRALPEMTPAEYRALVDGEDGALPAGCAGCHGPDGTGGGPFVPRLAGQHEAYLRDSLEAYADGRRASGIMQQAATGLSPEASAEIAARLAAVEVATEPGGAPAPEIAVRGRPEAGVPACLACHGAPQRNPLFPSLDGQPARYLEAQLRLFRDGERGGGPYSHVMTRAARGLADEDIETLAAWFEQRGGVR